MQDYQKKIGEFIAKQRKQKQLTQNDLADRLGTSQSAINRIESGKQNLTLEMVARISEVLDKELISLGDSSANLRVEGGHKLRGDVQVKTSKNGTVGILCAAAMNHGTTTIQDVPKIEEVYRLLEVLTSVGFKVEWKDDGSVKLTRPARLKLDKIDVKAAKKTRSVIMYLGSLMHDHANFKLPYAGGCKLGKRTVAPHLFALSEFGVDVKTKTSYYEVSVNKKSPGEIVLYEMGETVSENVLMAAALTDGITKIYNISSNYMVQDMCFFLEKCGVRIDGIGTHTLTVYGVDKINRDVNYCPAQDPVEAFSFISAAVATDSSIRLIGAPIDFLRVELLWLKKMGCKFDIGPSYKAKNGRTELVDIIVQSVDSLVAPSDKVHALMHPGINIDNLVFFAPILARAKGTSLIHDWFWEDRALYLTELRKLGVDVKLADPHRVYITGPSKLQSADIIAPAALRPAVVILITMLAAPGVSTLRNIYSISRGYEDFAERLNELGAKISVLRDI